MKPPDLTEAEMHSINELSRAMRALGEIFTQDEGTPAMLRVGVGLIYDGAEVLMALADRWEEIIGPDTEWMDRA